ncbi:MAG: exopolyphosphatase, partial [Methylocella sp.]
MSENRQETAPPTGIKEPLAIVDVGSNSVRLVVYECLSRSPRPIFNEKSLCALGRGVATTGRLP